MQGPRFSWIRPQSFSRTVALGAFVVPAVVAASALLACSKKEELPPTPPPAASGPAALHPSAVPSEGNPHAGLATGTSPAAGASDNPADLKWTAPERFKSAPNPSPMRKATYRIAPAAGDTEEAELSVSQAGGSIDANITRWAGQFEGAEATPKRSERTVGALKVTVVEVKGTFSGGGMPGMGAAPGPKKSWALRGAIVATEQPWFFKLTGPEKTVAAAAADFDKLIASVHP